MYDAFIYKNKYVIVKIFYKKNKIPLLIDIDNYEIVKSFNKINCDNHCNIYYFDENHHKKLLAPLLFGNEQVHVYYLNKISFDLRKENLTELPPLELISYKKQYKTVGDCYVFKHKSYNWKTTTSKKICKKTKYKIAYDHMTNYILTNQELFVDTQYDITILQQKRKLFKSFYKLITIAKYTNIYKLKLNKIGELVHEKHKISKDEKTT